MVKKQDIKTVEDKVDELINGKKQNIHITLHAAIRDEAEQMLISRGMEVRKHFDGPIFEDIAGYQIAGDWVAVSLKDGSTYAYPKSSIARIKHFNV